MDVPPDGWLTLSEAAARTGHTREAIRQRIRRGSLPATKGNDGQLRVQVRDLVDLPPPDVSTGDPGQPGNANTDAAASVLLATLVDLRTTVDDLRTTVDDLRTTLAATVDKAHADRLVDHGRAERAEAQAAAAADRAMLAERRLAAAETALAEARTPWAVRVIRAWRRPSQPET